MKFASAFDELQHWMGLLEIDVRLGVDRRHLNATARLCTLLVERLEQDPDLTVSRYEFNALSLRLLDLQRAIQSSQAAPNPSARRAGNFRVITGGRAQSGPTRR